MKTTREIARKIDFGCGCCSGSTVEHIQTEIELALLQFGESEYRRGLEDAATRLYEIDGSNPDTEYLCQQIRALKKERDGT